MSLELDRSDKEILDILQKDATVSNIDLSRTIGLSPSACLGRTKRLKELGVIIQRVTILDETKVGLGIVAFTFVNLSPHNRVTANEFIAKVKETSQIMECYNITGSWDYLLKIVSKDIASYRNFIMDSLLEFPGVNKIDTNLVLGTDKLSYYLPIE
jgi:Lrp/AsnC family leucine-responsive transcriptional regulator